MLEAKVLQQEIIILQNILQGHFGWQHRSLWRLSGIVHFHEARKIVDRMLENYFTHTNCQVSQICRVEDLAVKLHLPSFYRIMNNLVKNVLEANSSFLQLEYQQSGVNLHIRMASEAGIYSSTDRFKGTGLESVAYLVALQGGTFSHHCEHGQWITSIALPSQSSLAMNQQNEVA